MRQQATSDAALSQAAYAQLERAAADAIATRRDVSRGVTPAQSGTLHCLIAAPLLIGSSCCGALVLSRSVNHRPFSIQDVDVAAVIARHLAMVLENMNAFGRERLITERFRFLARTTERLFGTMDRAKMLQALLDALIETFADYAVAASISGDHLVLLAGGGTAVSSFQERSERAILSVLDERRSLLIDGNAAAQGGLEFGPLHELTPPRAWMMVPLFVGDAVYGAIVCCSNSRLFDRGDLELLQEIARRVSLALQHSESVARERRLAHTLQQATLPTQLAHIDNATLSVVYRPAASEDQVGGDWYDSFELEDRRILLTVGDVTGHGLQAAIIMGKIRHAINVVAMYERNPARILDAAERILMRRFPGSVATAFVAVLDPGMETLTYANAGHPYPLLRCGDGSLKELQADGLPLGLRAIAEPADAVTEILHDATLLTFYTDGLIEGTRDTLAGEKVLHEAVCSGAICYLENPAEFIEQYCLAGPSQDDVAILVLNFVRPKRWRFDSSDWRAARRARHEFTALLDAAASARSDVKAAELIFGELAANVAQHAGGMVEIALEWRSDQAALHVIDRGSDRVPTQRDQNDPFRESGRGLWLVQRLGAAVDVEILPGFGTHVNALLPIYRDAAEISSTMRSAQSGGVRS